MVTEVEWASTQHRSSLGSAGSSVPPRAKVVCARCGEVRCRSPNEHPPSQTPSPSPPSAALALPAQQVWRASSSRCSLSGAAPAAPGWVTAVSVYVLLTGARATEPDRPEGRRRPRRAQRRRPRPVVDAARGPLPALVRSPHRNPARGPGGRAHGDPARSPTTGSVGGRRGAPRLSPDGLPVVFHADHHPALLRGQPQRLLGATVVGVLTLGVVVVHQQAEARTGVSGGILEHVDVAV